MELPTHILLTYGYLLLFAWILVEQLGIPLPATPVLLAAGALSAEGQLSFPLAFLAALVAALMADSAWFHVGRRYGHQVLRLLCKLSWSPPSASAAHRTHSAAVAGSRSSLPSSSPAWPLLAAPVAGQYGMGYWQFLFYDAIGGMLWIGALLAIGRFFGDLLRRNPSLLNWAGRFSGALLLLGILGFFLARVYRRRAILKKLIASRLEPEELKKQLDAGEQVYIIDLRHPMELVPDPFTLPGAIHFSPDDLAARRSEIPRDRDIVLFCTCPSEATAAKTAMTLHKLGIERVRPLRGGYDEWKRLGFPLDAVPPALPAQP